MMENGLRLLDDTQARVNVTYKGELGDLPDPVQFEATDQNIKQWVTEALRTGGIPGITADAGADLTDFVVERYRARDDRPFHSVALRPKTPFGL
jgi:hypothetical protein